MTPDNLAMFIRKYISTKYISTIVYIQAKKVTDETPKLTIISPDSLISFHHCDKSVSLGPFRMGLCHMSFSCGAMPFFDRTATIAFSK